MDYIKDLTYEFRKILGITNLVFVCNTNKFDTRLIEKCTWTDEGEKLTQKTVDSLQLVINLINANYDSYKNADTLLEKSYVIQRIKDIFIYTLLLLSEKDNLNTVEDYSQIKNLKNFIIDLTHLSNQTYEQRMCTASFILIKEKDNPQDLLNSLNIDFISLDNNNFIILNDIHSYSKAYRLVDSLSLSYVINTNYNIIGLAKKRRKKRSVKEICLENVNEKMQFIYLEDKKINWYLDKERVFLVENGEWKLKDYRVIYAILEKMVLNDATKQFLKTENANTIEFLSTIIKDLSNNNVGSLFAIIDNNFTGEENKKYQDAIILKHMLKDEEESVSSLYKKIIKSKAENNIAINKKTLDPYLLKLIADVDGAVILNKKLEILDFGRMIATQNIHDSKNTFLQKLLKNRKNDFPSKSIETSQVQGGARSIATLDASTFGLAIKVSEDGVITIYKRRKLLFKL